MKKEFMASGPQDLRRLSRLDKREREALEFETGFFEKVLSADPCRLDALRALAENYTRLGFYHEGLKIDRRICILAPEDAVANYNLACSQALTGDAPGALATLARAWELGYREREHILHDEDLASLRGDPKFAEIIRRKESGGNISRGVSDA